MNRYLPFVFVFFIANILSANEDHTSVANNHVQFIENKGQVTDAAGHSRQDILYYSSTGKGNVYLRTSGLSYVILQETTSDEEQIAAPKIISGHRVDIDFEGANTEVVIATHNLTGTVFNYYLANCPGITSQSYGTVEYKNIYNKIDVKFYGQQQGGLKYDFIVRPGANPADIKLKYNGAEKLTLENEKLILTTSLGNMGEYIPKVYQVVNGNINEVSAKYLLTEEGSVSFELGEYKKELPLIIDPWVTFIGGSGDDNGVSICDDAQGGVVITGYTYSGSATTSLFPVTPGVFQLTPGGNSVMDAFISRFDSNGNLVFSTYFGGTNEDFGYSITSDATGNIFFAGATASPNLSTAGVVQSSPGGSKDMLIAKFSSMGTRIWSTYYGGNGFDDATSIELDVAGNIVLTGTSDGNFPTTATSNQPAFGGVMDAVIVKLNGNGTSVLWATYLGGSLQDGATDIDIDMGNNSIYVVGRTGKNTSNTNNFPTTAGTAAPTFMGGNNLGNQNTVFDGFITKFNSSGSLVWSTFYGGTWLDQCSGVAVDVNGDVVISGKTYSPDLPVTNGLSKGSNYQSFVAKLSGSAGTTTWCRYFADGSQASESRGVYVDKASNDIFVAGDIYGSGLMQWNCAHQKSNGGGGLTGEDTYLARLDANGNTKCNSYLGGTGHDESSMELNFTPNGTPGSVYLGGDILMQNGSIFITGSGLSTFPTTPNAYQPNFAGGNGTWPSDAFVAKICSQTCGQNKMNINFSANPSAVTCVNVPVSFSDLSNPCDPDNISWEWTFFGGTPATSTLQNPTGITYAATGKHDVKLVLHSPCGDDSLTQNNYITVSGPTAIINMVNNVACYGQSTGGLSVGVANGASPFSYSWSPVAGTNNIISNLAVGNYSVTITDAQGCKSSTSTSITQSPQLTAAAAWVKDATCNGTATGAATVAAAGGTPGYIYQWSNMAVQSTASVSGLIAGNYQVTVTDNYGCTVISNSVTIGEPTLLSIVTNTINLISCNAGSNGSVVAAANGGTGSYNYQWNTSPAQNRNIVTGLSAGTYTITVSDANGCTAEDFITMTEPTPVMLLAYTNNDAHCNQADGIATANVGGGTPGYVYSWSTNPVQNTAVASGLPAGTYTVSGTDANGCSAYIPVIVGNLNGVVATAAVSNSVTCFGSCDGTANGIPIGGNGPFNYLWSNGQISALSTTLCAGTYSLVITDADGCTDMDVVTIQQPQPVLVNSQNVGPICIGQNTTISATVNGGNGAYSYVWQPAAQTAQSIIVSPTTTSTFTVVVSDANGCSSQPVVVTVSVNPALNVQASNPVPVCNGNSVALTALASGGSGTYSYTWLPQNTIGNPISVSPGSTTAYTVKVDDNCNSPSAYATVTVSVNELPAVTFSASDSSGCAAFCTQFNNTTANAVSGAWSFGDGNTSTSMNPGNCFQNPGSYNISLMVTDANGCSNTLVVNNMINVFPNPIASFVSTPDKITITDPVVHFTDNSIGAYRWQWSFGDVINSYSSEQNPLFEYSDSGSYKVSLVVYNEFGCSDSLSKYVTVEPDYAIYFPNTFTPNGDNKNDIFKMAGIGVDEYELLIYDRWGVMIFLSTDINVGWDGRMEGQTDIVQQDVYVWKTNIKDIYGKQHRFTGHINLIK